MYNLIPTLIDIFAKLKTKSFVKTRFGRRKQSIHRFTSKNNRIEWRSVFINSHTNRFRFVVLVLIVYHFLNSPFSGVKNNFSETLQAWFCLNADYVFPLTLVWLTLCERKHNRWDRSKTTRWMPSLGQSARFSCLFSLPFLIRLFVHFGHIVFNDLIRGMFSIKKDNGPND